MRRTRSTVGPSASAGNPSRAATTVLCISSMAQRFALQPQHRRCFRGSRADRQASFRDEQQIVGLACPERRSEGDISRPVRRRDAVIEEKAEHPVARCCESLENRGAVVVLFVTGLHDQYRAIPAKDCGGSIEDVALMALDVDLDQIDAREAVLGGKRIETA